MSLPPEPNPNNSSDNYSFDDVLPEAEQNIYFGTAEEQRKWKQQKRREEDESLTESVLDEVNEGFGCSNRLLGCGWSVVTIPFRLVWKVISEIFD